MFADSMKEGINFYQRVLREAPQDVKARATPIWYSLPIILIMTVIILIFSKLENNNGNISIIIDSTISEIFLNINHKALHNFIDFIMAFISSCALYYIMSLTVNKGTRGTKLDPLEDALSGIRNNLVGEWYLEMDKFSNDIVSYGFDFTAQLTGAKKLFFQIRPSNPLGVDTQTFDIALWLTESNAQINLLFLITDQPNSLNGQSFKYLFQMKWINTVKNEDEADVFTGKWYNISTGATRFSTNGGCSMEKYPLNALKAGQQNQ